jgi:proline dehydrogenase
MKQHESEPREITMRDLYPNLTEEEILEAERNFDRYIEIVIRMYERRCGKPILTGLNLDHRIDRAPDSPQPLNPP